MKKLMIVILVLFFSFGLAACGGKETSVEEKNTTESQNNGTSENKNNNSSANETDDTSESGDNDNKSNSVKNGVASEDKEDNDSNKTPDEDEKSYNTIVEDENNDEELGANEEEEQGNESIDVNKNLFGVEITLPSSMFEISGQSVDEIIAEAKADGIDDVIKNPDGSLTYKMSKAKHDEMMEEMRTGFIETIDELTNGDFVSIQDVTYNNNFSEFTMIVDRTSFENGFDIFATFALGFTGMFYQLFDGENPDNIKVIINIKDAYSGEIFETVIYPDEMGI